MIHKRLLFFLPLILISAFAFAGGRQDTGETETVRFASDGFILGAQSWVAEEKGYFAEEGLKAEVSLFGTGIDAINAVITRQADLGPALDFAVLNLAATAAEEMRVVACIAEPSPGFHSLAVRNEINSPSDLAGKKIGYVEGTSEHLVTVKYLAQNGIDPDEVKLIPFSGLFEMVGALRADDIQAAWVWLSGTQEAEDDPNLKILADDSAVLETMATYLIARADWAKENQETIKKVVRAYDSASKMIGENVSQAAQIVADAVSGDAGMFEKAIPGQNFRVGFTQIQLDSFDSIAQFLIESGKLKEDFDIRKFISFDTMEKAVPGSVTANL